MIFPGTRSEVAGLLIDCVHPKCRPAVRLVHRNIRDRHSAARFDCITASNKSKTIRMRWCILSNKLYIEDGERGKEKYFTVMFELGLPTEPNLLFCLILLTEVQDLNVRFWMSSYEYQVLNVRFWMLVSECQIMKVRFWMSGSECPIMNAMFWMSGSVCPILNVRFGISDSEGQFFKVRFWTVLSFTYISSSRFKPARTRIELCRNGDGISRINIFRFCLFFTLFRL